MFARKYACKCGLRSFGVGSVEPLGGTTALLSDFTAQLRNALHPVSQRGLWRADAGELWLRQQFSPDAAEHRAGQRQLHLARRPRRSRRVLYAFDVWK